MKTPKNKKEYYQLIKDKPYLLGVVGLLLIILGPLVTVLGKGLIIGSIGYYLFIFIKKQREKKDGMD